MQIQLNTDRHIEGSEKLRQEVETIVQHALARFSDRITSVEVFLSDENSSQKSGDSDKRCSIEARLSGLQPITVSHRGSTVDQALDGSTDKLEKTLKRALGRKDSLSKRRVHERAELAAAASLLENGAKTGKQEDFEEALRPLLGPLGHHARRELRIMESSGTLYPGQVALSDVVNEVVTRAWLQFASRPPWMALDLWLTRMLDEVLEEQIHDEQPIQSFLYRQADEVVPRDVPQVGEQDWWVWLLDDNEAISEDNAIPSQQTAWAEEFLEAEELMERVHAILGELPKMQRRAFVLHVLEAYDPAEVAMLQNRSETQVSEDIKAARRQLCDRLRAGGGHGRSDDRQGRTLERANISE